MTLPAPLADKRIAIVHPWLVETRGGELAFFEMARALPTADLFLLFARVERLPADLQPRLKGTSFLQRFPKPAYRATLPLLPAAAESLPLQGYDVVLSSSSGWTHGVLTADHATHVSYMHSPPRYVWGAGSPVRAASVARPVLAPLLHYLRLWDSVAADRVDAFLANSAATARKVRSRYRRAATVLHPPVNVDRFLRLPRRPDGYAVVVGELVPYKRTDRAIAACRLAGVPLKVIGDGPDRARLERLAGSGPVEFLGRVRDALVDDCLAHASVYVHGGVEDFGIATVEAMAAGVPIAGIDAGGTAEIGQNGGAALADPSDEGLAGAIRRCIAEPERFHARDAALRYSAESFRAALVREVSRAVTCNSDTSLAHHGTPGVRSGAGSNDRTGVY